MQRAREAAPFCLELPLMLHRFIAMSRKSKKRPLPEELLPLFSGTRSQRKRGAAGRERLVRGVNLGLVRVTQNTHGRRSPNLQRNKASNLTRANSVMNVTVE